MSQHKIPFDYSGMSAANRNNICSKEQFTEQVINCLKLLSPAIEVEVLGTKAKTGRVAGSGNPTFEMRFSHLGSRRSYYLQIVCQGSTGNALQRQAVYFGLRPNILSHLEPGAEFGVYAIPTDVETDGTPIPIPPMYVEQLRLCAMNAGAHQKLGFITANSTRALWDFCRELVEFLDVPDEVTASL